MKTLQQIVDESKSIVFFGGAGVSTESGIPDFRSADGLYNQKYDVPPEELLSHEYFFEHTGKFFEFYREKMLCLDAKPNKAHLKLAELERAGKLTAVITQNIDGLHTAAGSKTVYELHGSVHRNYCLKCGKSYSAEDILKSEGVPHCKCGGIIKPDVVLNGENLDDRTVTGALAAIESCDTLIIAELRLPYILRRDLYVISAVETWCLLICLPLLMTAEQTLPYTIRSERCLTR